MSNETVVINEGAEVTQLNLLTWAQATPREAPAVPYNRIQQFGKWIQFKKTKGCFDVRAQVLIRDSLIPATSTDAKPCTIEQGEWLDPYTNQKFTLDGEIQIDHMVPLKEAYDAGAMQWSRSKRCVYANFLGMKQHLISTSNFENQSKSDKTPAEYIPPQKDYVCTYLKNWLNVKLVWKLSMSSIEAAAIKNYVKEYGCHEADFMVEKKTIDEIRKIAQSYEALCPIPKSPVKPTPVTPAPK